MQIYVMQILRVTHRNKADTLLLGIVSRHVQVFYLLVSGRPRLITSLNSERVSEGTLQWWNCTVNSVAQSSSECSSCRNEAYPLEG